MVTVLLLGLFLMRESEENTHLRHIEEGFGDWVAANAPATPRTAHITLVEINDSSLTGEHAWPWSPLEYAIFLSDAIPLKPDVVAIEPVLNWEGVKTVVPQDKMEQYSKFLHDQILLAPKIVLGAQLGFPEDETIVPPKLPAPILRNVKGDIRSIPALTDIVRQPGEDYRLASVLGFTNFPVPDGTARMVPLVFNYRGEIVPSMVLQTLIQWFKLTADDVTVEPGASVRIGEKVTIPIDDSGKMLVDFNSRFTRFGYDDLLLAVAQQQRDNKAEIPVESIAGSIVLLARTDTQTSTLTDPRHLKTSPGELFTRAIATVQNQSFAHRVTYIFDFAVIISVMVLSCFYHKLSKKAVFMVSLMALLFYLFTSMTVYSQWMIWLPLILPTGLMVLVNFFSIFSHREPLAPAKPLP